MFKIAKMQNRNYKNLVLFYIQDGNRYFKYIPFGYMRPYKEELDEIRFMEEVLKYKNDGLLLDLYKSNELPTIGGNTYENN